MGKLQHRNSRTGGHLNTFTIQPLHYDFIHSKSGEPLHPSDPTWPFSFPISRFLLCSLLSSLPPPKLSSSLKADQEAPACSMLPKERSIMHAALLTFLPCTGIQPEERSYIRAAMTMNTFYDNYSYAFQVLPRVVALLILNNGLGAFAQCLNYNFIVYAKKGL